MEGTAEGYRLSTAFAAEQADTRSCLCVLFQVTAPSTFQKMQSVVFRHYIRLMPLFKQAPCADPLFQQRMVIILLSVLQSRMWHQCCDRYSGIVQNNATRHNSTFIFFPHRGVRAGARRYLGCAVVCTVVNQCALTTRQQRLHRCHQTHHHHHTPIYAHQMTNASSIGFPPILF